MDSDQIDDFEAALEAHGELHCEYEEWGDDELEVRLGQYDTAHRDADGTFTLWKHGQPFDFQYDRIVSWYEPHELRHGH